MKIQTRKMQRAGLHAPVVYSHPDNNIHKQWFDLFMENITRVNEMPTSAYGVALEVDSSFSSYKKNGKIVYKLLLKLLKMGFIENKLQNFKKRLDQAEFDRELRRHDTFDKEVETQMNFYSATISKSLNDCLCPKIVYFSSNYKPHENNFELYRVTPKIPLLVKNYSERDECFRATNYLAVRK